MTVQDLMNELNKFSRNLPVKIAFTYDCGYAWGEGSNINVVKKDGKLVIESEEDL